MVRTWLFRYIRTIVLECSNNLSFQVLSQFDILCFVMFWVFEVYGDFRFWVLSHVKTFFSFISFGPATIRFFWKLDTIWVLFQLMFLSFVTIWFFECWNNECLSFVQIWVFKFFRNKFIPLLIHVFVSS